MPTTPNWESAVNGPSTNLEATNHATQVNQLLGTHAITPVYEGNQLVTPVGGTLFTWVSYGNTTDLSQPFVMPGGHTSVGRITLPINPVNNGAGFLVMLCPDNGSGSPNTLSPLASTNIPASWLLSTSNTTGLLSAGNLAVGRYNTLYVTGGSHQASFAPAAGGANPSTFATSGAYVVSLGGTKISSTDSAANVSSNQYLGNGVLAATASQPSLPVPVTNGSAVITGSTIVYAGGFTQVGASTTDLSSVFTASWDPNMGVVGSWSTQTNLPAALQSAGTASNGDTIYIVGGKNSSGNAVNSLYQTTISNNQITGWISSTIPQALSEPIVTVINGWLFIIGGISNPSLGTLTNGVYYARILSDGSLGPWLTGPTFPYLAAGFGSGCSVTTTDTQILVGAGVGPFGSLLLTLAVYPTGPADQWVQSDWTLPGTFGLVPMVVLSSGGGTWDLATVDPSSSLYEFANLDSVPLVSVPLPATGLTAGATYHVVLQQYDPGNSQNNVQYGILNVALPNDALKSSRHSGTWIAAQTGYSVPLTVYDNTPGGNILHTWEDPSSTGSTNSSNLAPRVSTTIYNPFNFPIGVLESVTQPNDPMNKNPTFATGVSSWTPANSTFVQSNAQTHGGFPFSGLFTPNGVATAPKVTSELIPIPAVTQPFNNGQWYVINGWFYSPTGYSSVNVGIDWYDSAFNFLSTSNNFQSIGSATWTNIVNPFLQPNSAAFMAIDVQEGGTPSSSNMLFLSNVTISLSPEATSPFSSVAQITYGSTPYPPTGVVQLN